MASKHGRPRADQAGGREGGRGRLRLPCSGVSRARTHALGPNPRGDPWARPVSRRGASRGARLFGFTWGAAAAESSQYLQGTAARPRRAAYPARPPRWLGEARRAAPQFEPDGRGLCAGKSRQMGLAAADRPAHPSGSATPCTEGLFAVGRTRAGQGGVDQGRCGSAFGAAQQSPVPAGCQPAAHPLHRMRSLWRGRAVPRANGPAGLGAGLVAGATR